MAVATNEVILLLGDSLTQRGWEAGGFAQKLAYVYSRKLDVLNRGLSGYNTEWALPVFKQSFAKVEDRKGVPPVAILTIWFGANDACIKPSPQHVPIDRFIENLKEIISTVKSPQSPYYSPATKIILFTPPPINTIQRAKDLASRNPPLALDRLFEVTEAYAEAVRSVGRDEGLAVVDVYRDLWDASGRNEGALERFLTDGLHLNADGYEIVFKGLLDAIGRDAPELLPQNMRYVSVPWDAIDWENPAATLGLRSARIS